jgi:hypothetical protein
MTAEQPACNVNTISKDNEEKQENPAYIVRYPNASSRSLPCSLSCSASLSAHSKQLSSLTTIVYRYYLPTLAMLEFM